MARRSSKPPEMDIACNPPIYFWDKPRLRGKNVLIVGGTHGVGAATAKLCLSYGAKVSVVGLSNNPSIKCQQYIFDVASTPTAVFPLTQYQDYILNNIGMISRGMIVGTTRNMVHRMLLVNVEIMFLLTQYALQSSAKVVVNMGSRPVFSANKEWSLYAMTKHAIIDLTRAADEESDKKFYAFCPSRMDTKFRDSVLPNEDKSTRLPPEEAAKYVVTLFNGKNPTGHYWVRRVYEGANGGSF